MPSIKKVGDGIYELDLKGYVCPYPQMYTAQALKKLSKGVKLKVVIDNPPSIENIKNLAQKEGVKIASIEAKGGTWEILLEL
ncbi:putative redox protein, regulator of disulfide bond formation [Pyrobaculum oguniense TE7]|uniref:Redox protein, regulator of disulfide bond formation n=1 Tax=Pyrobaculum oguniense (strain DSM 13380 / JCM 10595 / TE7) TaxID=698757 RepID=H6Q933_PYROT|nr:putative redox protein, regulator of disulfide bond formation [Pyrobaculum oguniense TE7]